MQEGLLPTSLSATYWGLTAYGFLNGSECPSMGIEPNGNGYNKNILWK